MKRDVLLADLEEVTIKGGELAGYCKVCGLPVFRHPSGRGQLPKYCSPECKIKARYDWYRPARTTEQRFAEKYVPNEAGCWIWQAVVESGHYGQFYYQGRMHKAHRVAYILFIGPIPEGYVVDHLCGVRRCVNPAHLEAITPAENLRRAHHYERRVTHCPSGHEYDDENTRIIRRPNGRTARACRRCERERQRRPDGYIAQRRAACGCACCDH